MQQLLLPLMLAGLFGLLLYSSSRTRKRNLATAAELKANLVPGREIMTGSGLFATVVEVEEDAVILETSPGVTSRWLLAAISKIVDPPVPGDEVLDDEYEDEYDDDEYEDDDDTADDELELDVPDDVSSLTTDPGEDDAPRR